MPRVTSLVRLVCDLGAGEDGVNGSRGGSVGAARVVHDALKLLGIGEAPVAIAEVAGGVLRLDPRQGVGPVHPDAAVALGPHQAGGFVRDGLVAVIHEQVEAVARVAAHTLHEEGLVRTVQDQAIALDPPVGEVDAEQFSAFA